jgi:hypothetical protein
VGLSSGAYFYFHRPENPVPRVEVFSLPRTMDLWHFLSRGIDAPPISVETEYYDALARRRFWLIAGAMLTAIGLAVVASSFFLPRHAGVNPAGPRGSEGR